MATKKPAPKKATTKTTTTKKPAVNKTAAKTPVKKTAAAKTTPVKAAAKRPATKKTTARKVATKQAPAVKSFKASADQQDFQTFKITRQTVYWVILVSAIIFAQLWILKTQYAVLEILDTQLIEGILF